VQVLSGCFANLKVDFFPPRCWSGRPFGACRIRGKKTWWFAKMQKTSKAGIFKVRFWRFFATEKEAVHAFSRVDFLTQTSIDAGFAGRR
jgi:hypothetical protein